MTNDKNDLSAWCADKRKTILFQKATLQSILNWANHSEDSKYFNPGFIHSLLIHVQSGKVLSKRQVSCLDKIITSFKIDIKEWT